MNTIVVTSTKQNIKFGYEGEDNVTKIIFPYDESWLEYGEGNFEVRILRCGDEVAYTATEVVDDRQAMTLTMTVTDIELSVRGRGEMQLCYVCPDSIKKSPIYQYTVNRSVDYKYAVDPPEGSIIASVEKSLSEIKNTTNRLSNSVISIESSIDDVNSQIDNINDKISEFDEEIDSIGEVETRVDNLETSIQSINGRINTAEGNINENTESISDLNESVTELENRKVTDLETSGGRSDSGKYLTVGTDGKIKATSLTIPPTITVDESLSTTSTNPVQNKVIKTELNNINSNIATCNTEISKINGSLVQFESELNVDGKAHASANYTVIQNSQVASGSGAISESTSLSRSDYTDLQGCEYFTLTGTTFVNYCVYDADKKYISGVAPAPSGNIQRPSNAKYIIFTAHKAGISEAELDLYNCDSVVGTIYDELDKKVENSTAFGETYYNGKVLLAKAFGVTKFPGNLVDISECVDGYYISAGNGTPFKNSSYFRTGYIPVVAGSTYKANHGRAYAWYDSNKEYLSGFNNTDIQTGITAPDNSAYIRFSINKSNDGISDPFSLYFANSTEYTDETVIEGLVVTQTHQWCYGKKINWIGDSIVAGIDFDEEVCSALGLVKENEYGIDGSTISLNGNSGDARNAICERYTDMSNDADIIVVSAGTNDWMYAWAPIGDIEEPDDGSANRTFYGALKALCKGLIDKYPNKVIFFTTPIKRAQSFENGNGGEYTADGIATTPYSKNKYGKTLGDYADIIKEVCGYYSIPVLDMYRESLLNPHIASQQSMFDSALTHPNATGRKIMARRICGWITQLGYSINGLND